MRYNDEDGARCWCLLRAVSLSKVFAEVHLGDGDILGEWARELRRILEQEFPNIDMADDEEDRQRDGEGEGRT